MLVITGWNSTIAQRLRDLLRVDEPTESAEAGKVRPDADRYLFCHGAIQPKSGHTQTPDEVAYGFWANYVSVITDCRRILTVNDKARICIVGSESGYRGSFDDIYAAAKAAVHLFVEREQLRPNQQLVAVSPGVIIDAGMTTRRHDFESLQHRADAHPKQRFITSAEVAAMIHHLLYVDLGYTTGTVIRMHGGLK